ncbi:MAG: class I SAM-dependent methyltransferase, partial [Anaerolineae bacterium]|nr:class I SAM-dependent methyltransferase [Anaerolineae bacterium]
MSIFQFGAESKFRDATTWRRPWIPSILRPINAMARLHFLLILRSLRQLLPTDKRWRILEAGTKQGFLSFWLARSSSHQIVGLDLDQTVVSANEQLAEKLNLPNLTFTQADLTQSLDPIGTFDLVICVHVLEHIKEDRTALKNLAKIINPGGYLLVLVPGGIDTVPEFTQHELDILDHVRPGYSLAELTQKVETAGFRVISSRPGFGLWGSWA